MSGESFLPARACSRGYTDEVHVWQTSLNPLRSPYAQHVKEGPPEGGPSDDRRTAVCAYVCAYFGADCSVPEDAFAFLWWL